MYIIKAVKKPADTMMQEPDFRQMAIEEIKTPFERELDKNNRRSAPGEKLAEIDAKELSRVKAHPAKPSRMVISALIMKDTLRLPDEKLMPSFPKNPCLQYFWVLG